MVSELASGLAAASAQAPTPGSHAALAAAAAAQASTGAGGTATGSGATASRSLYSLDAQGNAVITGYAGTASQLSIPAAIDGHPVTAIGASAFQGSTSLTSVTLPSSVTAVGDYAFADCPKLAKVDLGGKLASLGAGAFLNDTALRQIAVPATLTGCGMVWTGTEGIGPFGGCAGLASVELAGGMAAVPAYLLTGCASTALEVAVPPSVTAFGTDALALAAGPQALTIVADPGTFAQQYAEQNGLAWRDPSVHATGVTLNVGSLNLKNGASQQLSATIEPPGVTDPVTWSSSNPAVARVDTQGKVTALKAGTATVTVSVSGLSASCDVTVWQPVLSIELNRGAFSAEAAEGRQLVATCLPADATNKAVTWSSSNPSVATVNAQTGLVTTVGEGTCAITATAADGAGARQTCAVTVTSNSYTVGTVEELASPHPYANSCTDAWVYTVPGAQVISVSFDQRTMAENTFDSIEVYDGSGNLMGAYTGSELAGATLTLPGDTVRVKLDTDAEVDAWGFAVASVTAVEPQGWIGIAGLTYYYVDGRPCYGEQWIDGAWYYFDPRSGAMVTGFVKLPNGPIRYYNHHGAMVTGNVTIAGQNYDFDVNTGDLIIDNSVNIEVNNVTNNTTVNNNTVIVIDQDITVNPEPPAPGPDEPDPPAAR